MSVQSRNTEHDSGRTMLLICDVRRYYRHRLDLESVDPRCPPRLPLQGVLLDLPSRSTTKSLTELATSVLLKYFGRWFDLSKLFTLCQVHRVWARGICTRCNSGMKSFTF
jgi:hypothetical protein